MAAESKCCAELRIDVLERAVPRAQFRQALEETGAPEQQPRKLNRLLTAFGVIGMNRYRQSSIGAVMERLAQGLRYIGRDPEYSVAGDSAIGQRRYPLGIRPLATEGTPGAFLFDLRPMALDGTREDVPDSRANSQAFGRPIGDRGDAAFPQVLALYLIAWGTHAIVDAGFWPYTVSEKAVARRELHDLAVKPLLKRRARSNPRVVKRKLSNFRLKYPERYHWPQPSSPFHQAIALI